MDALKIAFETVIVGALALPWLVLLVYLFSSEKDECHVGYLLSRAQSQKWATIAGVLLFALAYLLGSSVARLAEDLSNDDDLIIFPTEDSIREAVYCVPDDDAVVKAGTALVESGFTNTPGQPKDRSDPCSLGDDDRATKVRQVFSVQEASLLLADGDKTARVRYLHQQLGVLRGAVLNGLIATLLCFFAFCAPHRQWCWKKLLALVPPLVLLGLALYAMRRHLCGLWDCSKHPHAWEPSWEPVLREPPMMELVLIAIAVAGVIMSVKGVTERCYGRWFFFSLALTLLAFCGWWFTEILYDQTVVYFFYSCRVLQACP